VKYHYKPDGHRELGPVDSDVLFKLVQAGRVNLLTPVRPQRTTEWSTAGRLLPHLFAQPESSTSLASIPWGCWELERPAPKPRTEWENSLGMKFVSVPGTEVLFSVWHTRVQDFEPFGLTREQALRTPGYPQGPLHPVVSVDGEIAQAFAKWLTEKERWAGRITARQRYRLPRDWEWSVAVGLIEARAGTPKMKDGKIKGMYPWGTQWPPPWGAGNYEPSLNVDDYEFTSPVGSFAANVHGLYDMGGNAWQWCEDSYDERQKYGVLRGGSWFSSDADTLVSSFRLACGFRNSMTGSDHGFRLVLAGGSARLEVGA